MHTPDWSHRILHMRGISETKNPSLNSIIQANGLTNKQLE